MFDKYLKNGLLSQKCSNLKTWPQSDVIKSKRIYVTSSLLFTNRKTRTCQVFLVTKCILIGTLLNLILRIEKGIYTQNT